MNFLKINLHKFLPSIFAFVVVLLTPVEIVHANAFTDFMSGVMEFADKGLGYTVGLLLSPIIGSMTSLMATLVGWTASIFDAAITLTITDYSSFFGPGSPIQEGVNTVWASFRDLANIVMIGVFVYIAFMVMLNVQSFSAEKYAVHVLVVALLVNFSLFFTKVVIDISNITAIQFHKALTSNGTVEIGTAFIQKIGAASAWWGNIGEAAAASMEQGLTGLLAYGIFTSLFFAAVAAVFLYAIILLVSRALTFIVLMAVSPLAFAAYMIPQLEKHLSKWWSLLINNALFAPLLMMMLWATLQITDKINGDGQAIAKMIAGDISSAEMILKTAIILGLFYASIKIASSLSLMGTNLAESIARKGFGVGAKWMNPTAWALRGIGAGAAGTASWAARNTAGRAASGLQKINRRGVLGMSSQKLDKTLEQMKTSGMRIGDSKKAAELAAKAGISLQASSMKDDQAWRQKKMEQKREDQAAGEKQDAAALTKKAQEAPGTMNADETKQYIAAQRDQLKMYQKAFKKDSDAAEKKRNDATKTAENIDKRMNKIMNDMGNGPGTQEQRDELNALNTQKAATEREIAKETSKIEQVKQSIDDAEIARDRLERGLAVNTDMVMGSMQTASEALGDDSTAKREIEAIHQMKDTIREQLMEKQFFKRENYQVPEGVGLSERAWDPRAKEAHKQARKAAAMPEHYNKMAGRMKGDEAASNEEIADRALRGL